MAIDKSHGINRRIVIRSVNLKGLKRMRPFFGRLGIQTKLYSYPESNYLIISEKENLEKFSAFIGFTSKRKRAKLREALDRMNDCERDLSFHCDRFGQVSGIVWICLPLHRSVVCEHLKGNNF